MGKSYSFEIKRLVQAPLQVAWSVISDVGAYSDYAPNLSRSELLEGEGVGLRRRCYDTQGRAWNEQCVLWEEGRVYSIVVDTSDYLYPFAKMQGTWGLDGQPGGVLVRMKFDYTPSYDPPLIGPLVDRLVVKRAMNRICQKLLDNWEVEINRRSEQNGG